MRRTQSVRNHAKAASIAANNDDLGVLRENEEGAEETSLRRQLLEKDRENDGVRAHLLAFGVYSDRMNSCNARSSNSKHSLRNDLRWKSCSDSRKNILILSYCYKEPNVRTRGAWQSLTGTPNFWHISFAFTIEIRTKARERALESQLEKLAGPNWQVNVLTLTHYLHA